MRAQDFFSGKTMQSVHVAPAAGVQPLVAAIANQRVYVVGVTMAQTTGASGTNDTLQDSGTGTVRLTICTPSIYATTNISTGPNEDYVCATATGTGLNVNRAAGSSVGYTVRYYQF